MDSPRFANLLSMALRIDPVTVLPGNVTVVSGGEQAIGANSLKLLDQLTTHDRALLDQLMTDGLLRKRVQRDLDEEFRMTAERLEFTFAS